MHCYVGIGACALASLRRGSLRRASCSRLATIDGWCYFLTCYQKFCKALLVFAHMQRSSDSSLPLSDAETRAGPENLTGIFLDGAGYLEPFSGSGDADNLTLLAWVFLYPEDLISFQIVASNRDSGCSLGPRTSGFALGVAATPSSDSSAHTSTRLAVQWSSRTNACETLETEVGSVPVGAWTQVMMSFNGGSVRAGDVSLYVDGAHSVRRRLEAGSRLAQYRLPLRIGMFADDDGGLYGKLAHVALLSLAVLNAEDASAFMVRITC